VQDDLGFAQNPARFHSEQFRVTGTRADQIDFAIHLMVPRDLRWSAVTREIFLGCVRPFRG
jgi:hypothetical protein